MDATTTRHQVEAEELMVMAMDYRHEFDGLDPDGIRGLAREIAAALDIAVDRDDRVRAIVVDAISSRLAIDGFNCVHTQIEGLSEMAPDCTYDHLVDLVGGLLRCWR